MPMKLDFGKTELKINFSFAVAVTLTLIIDESGVGATALLCCIIHEMGHIICLLLLGEKPKRIELSFYGIKLERYPMSAQKTAGEIAVFVSGPSANLIFSSILFLMSNIINSLRDAAIISLCIGAFNLIPCKPLDGGNILYAVLCGNTKQNVAEKICFFVSAVVLVPLVVSGVYYLRINRNITLLAVALYVAATCISEYKSKTALE